MLFNEYNTALHFLSSRRTPDFYIHPGKLGSCIEAYDFMSQLFPKKKMLFRNKIQFICDSALQSYKNTYFPIKHSLAQIMEDKAGTLILPVPENHISTIFYDLQVGSNGSGATGRMIIFQTVDGLHKPSLGLYAEIENDQLKVHTGTDTFREQMVIGFIRGLIAYPQYYPIESKVLQPGKKTFFANQDFANGTDLPIELLHDTFYLHPDD